MNGNDIAPTTSLPPLRVMINEYEKHLPRHTSRQLGFLYGAKKFFTVQQDLEKDEWLQIQILFCNNHSPKENNK